MKDYKLKQRNLRASHTLGLLSLFSKVAFVFLRQAQGSMAAKKQGKMPAESGIEEYFIVGSNFGGGGTLTAKGSKKVVYVCVCVCVRACVFVDHGSSGTVAVRKCRLDWSKERQVFVESAKIFLC